MITCANANQNTEAESAETEICSSPIEQSPKTPSSQKSIPVISLVSKENKSCIFISQKSFDLDC